MKWLSFVLFSFAMSLSAATGVIIAQNDAPRLLGKFAKGDIGEFNYRVIQTEVRAEFGKMLIVRICSKRKLSFALATAPGIASSFGQADGIVGLVKRYNVGIDSVYFATYAACDVAESRLPIAEYWQVSDISMLAVDEILPAEEVEVITFLSFSRSEFSCDLAKFSSLLVGGRFRGYVIGGYNTRPSNQLKMNVGKVERLIRSVAPESHYEVVYQEHDGILESGVEPVFPRLVLIRLKTGI
jgi:hypothetical protein